MHYHPAPDAGVSGHTVNVPPNWTLKIWDLYSTFKSSQALHPKSGRVARIIIRGFPNGFGAEGTDFHLVGLLRSFHFVIFYFTIQGGPGWSDWHPVTQPEAYRSDRTFVLSVQDLHREFA